MIRSTVHVTISAIRGLYAATAFAVNRLASGRRYACDTGGSVSIIPICTGLIGMVTPPVLQRRPSGASN
jgi:hypothetical protein